MAMNIKVGTVYIDVEPDVSKFSEKLRRNLENSDLGKSVEKTLDKATQSVVKFGKESDRTSVSLDKIGDRTSNFNNKMLLLRNTIGLLKIPAAFAGLGVLAQALVSVGAGAVATVSALGPLAGLLVTLPAGLLAVAAASTTVKLAFSGVKEALKGTKGAMEKLGPAGQQFVKFLKEFEPLKKELQDIAQSNLLPGITKGMREAFSPTNISAVKGIIADVGKSLGQLAVKLGQEFRDPAWAKALRTISETSTMAFKKLGGSAIEASSGFRDLLIAGQPLVRWLTDVTSRGIKLVGIWAGNAAASGRAAKFFKETKEITRTLGGILGKLASVLINVGKAAYPLGKGILVALNEQLTRLRDWTASAGGQKSLAAYFERTLPVLKAAVYLMAALGKMIVKVGDAAEGSGLAAFFDQIRLEVLPLFEESITGAEGLGQALLDITVAAGKLIAIFLSSTGPLTAFAHLLSLAATALTDLVANNPLLAELLVTFLSIAAITKVFNVRGMISGIMGVVAAYQAQSVAAGGAATMQQRLNLAMRANPIGLVITALQLLAVGLIVLWKRSETFRDIVNGTWASIKENVATVVAFLQNLWSKYGDRIIAITRASMGVLADAIRGYMKVIQGVIDVVMGLIKGDWARVWDGLKQIVSGAFQALTAVVRNAGPAIITAAYRMGQSIVEGLISGLASLPGRLFTALVSPIQSALDKAKKYLQINTPSKLVAKELGEPIGEGLVYGLLTGVGPLPDKMKESVKKAIEAARVEIAASRSSLADSFGTVSSIVEEAFSAISSKIPTKSEGILNKLISDRDVAEFKNNLGSARAAVEEASFSLALFESNPTAGPEGTVLTPEEIVAKRKELGLAVVQAQKEVDDLLFQQKVANLQKNAERERLDQDAKLAIRKQNLTNSLAALVRYLNKEGTSTSTATKKILKLMSDFGVDFESVGASMGEAWVSGLKGAITKAAKGAGSLEGVINESANKIKSAPKKLPKMAAGGYLQPGRVAIVGEAGPEILQAGKKGTTVTPVGSGPLVNVESMSVRETVDIQLLAAALYRKAQTA